MCMFTTNTRTRTCMCIDTTKNIYSSIAAVTCTCGHIYSVHVYEYILSVCIRYITCTVCAYNIRTCILTWCYFHSRTLNRALLHTSRVWRLWLQPGRRWCCRRQLNPQQRSRKTLRTSRRGYIATQCVAAGSMDKQIQSLPLYIRTNLKKQHKPCRVYIVVGDDPNCTCKYVHVLVLTLPIILVTLIWTQGILPWMMSKHNPA